MLKHRGTILLMNDIYYLGFNPNISLDKYFFCRLNKKTKYINEICTYNFLLTKTQIPY